MNPKPFASLNHLTVPVAIPTSPVTHVTTTSPRKATTTRGSRSLLTSSPSAFFRDYGLVKKVPA
ncbi:hypothetical protein F6X37_26780 [Paraburkholderia sp. 31.1]|nr:hypothetical protein [Paraburkholderia sp. 31.1]